VYSSSGLLPFSSDLDTIGPLARTVADIARFDALARDYDLPRVPDIATLRIGVPRQYYWEELDPDVARVAEAALAKLRERGVGIVEVDVSSYVSDAAEGFRILCFDGGLRGDLPAYFADLGMNGVLAGLQAKDVRRLVEIALLSPNSVEVVESTRRQRIRVRERYQALFREHRLDAILFPTVAIPPPRIHQEGDPAESTTTVNGKELPTTAMMIRNTLVTSYLGAPGLSVPAGVTTAGLPTGMELDALPGEDAKLLAMGRAIENVWGSMPYPRRHR
jgi:Asp-tRNA(Asn)/Glu-tRNA(Gln) amidotransferase A subunit family amidase